MCRYIMGKKQNRGLAAAKSASASPKSLTMPSVSDMSTATRGAASQQRKVSDDERLYLTCFCFSTNGSVYNVELFDDERLIQVQMTCAALPSPVFNMMQLVRLYKENSEEEGDGTAIPEDMEAVSRQYAAQFSYVGKRTPDPDSVGFKKNRSGWYVSEKNLKPFLMYFDDLMSFRTKFSDSEFDAMEPDLKIILRLSAGLSGSVELDTKKDELLCAWSVENQDSEATWPVRVFDLPPPSPTYPLRFIQMTLELLARDKMNVIFGGNTKPFHSEFTTQEIKLKTQKMSGSAYPEYYRVMEHVPIDQDVTACVGKIKHVLENILYGSPVSVQLNAKKHDTDLVQQLLAEVKQLPNIEVRD